MDRCKVWGAHDLCVANTNILSNRAKRSFRPLKSSRREGSSVPSPECAGSAGRNAHTILPETGTLRCQLCHGRRSSSYHINYHINHLRYPSMFPQEGICSRRRTGCAAIKARLQASHALPVIYELAADDMVSSKLQNLSIRWERKHYKAGTISRFSGCRLSAPLCQSTFHPLRVVVHFDVSSFRIDFFRRWVL